MTCREKKHRAQCHRERGEDPLDKTSLNRDENVPGSAAVPRRDITHSARYRQGSHELTVMSYLQRATG